MATRASVGNRLRASRKQLGLSLREVHRESLQLAKALRNRNFAIPASRLHFYETRKATPSIYRLYTISKLYGYKLTEVLGWYGVPAR